MEAIEINPGIFRYVSEDIRSDKEVVLNVLIKGGGFDYAAEDLKSDKEFILEAIEKGVPPSRFTWNMAERLKVDQEFILAAVKINPKAIEMASDEIKKKIAQVL